VGNASKGFRPNRKVYKLNFEDDEYEGLVVLAKSLSLDEFLNVAGLAKLDPKDIQPEDIDKFGELFTTFSKALVEWNLEDEETGEPVPTTLEGIRSQDADFVMPIIKAWFGAIAGVAGPLGPPSSNGGKSLEPSIPMEAR
jgi:hypothetical protein